MLSLSANDELSHRYAQKDYFTAKNGLITAQAYSTRREHAVLWKEKNKTEAPSLIISFITQIILG